MFTTTVNNLNEKWISISNSISISLKGKIFNNQANTMVHLRAHTNEKTYRCRYCDHGFYDSSTLKKHERTHTGEKPYACPHCDKRFTQSGNLKRHVPMHAKYQYEQSKAVSSYSTVDTNGENRFLATDSSLNVALNF
jgi:uncharacterized Zn-finger protein